jgi:hypothetical protein
MFTFHQANSMARSMLALPIISPREFLPIGKGGDGETRGLKIELALPQSWQTD